MYENIENLYKKHSLYNKIKKKIFVLYIVVFPFLLIFNEMQNDLLLFFLIIIAFFLVKNIYEKVLGVSLVLSFNNDSNKMPVSYIIMSKEKELFKKYLQDANLYTKDSLMCIINHYRCYIKSKVVNENFLAILSLVVSVALTFLGPNGFDFNSIEKNLPYLIGLGLIVAFIYFSFKEIINIRKIFTGEDGMIERLEAIFSELYVEYDETIHLSSVNRRKRTAKSNNSKTTK